MLDNQELLESQYDVVAGNWPQNYNEVVLIADKNNEVSDYTLYSLGIKDVSELKELYSQQLLLYKNAMEQCTPYKVSKCIIYSITLGEFVEV